MFNTLLCSLLPFVFCSMPSRIQQPSSFSIPTGISSDVSIESRSMPSASSTGSTEVIIKDGGATTTALTMDAPYGVESRIVSENGKTYATTTAISRADFDKMQAQAAQEQADLNRQMDQMMQDQQKLFDDMRTGL